jgi:hypothetical protein
MLTMRVGLPLVNACINTDSSSARPTNAPSNMDES